ncbi:hypothetical protein HKX48_009075 [Thoreauomyces humboldtii]|nr:hypothetical protein HKX48_009075 [Thoreauomyces humboldtii]
MRPTQSQRSQTGLVGVNQAIIDLVEDLRRADDPARPDLIAETRRRSFQHHNVEPAATTKGDPLHRHADEGPNSARWANRKKHFFILSSAGKPIYSRYGDESKLSSFMGLIQAIISFYVSDDDSVRCLNAGVHKFVFSMKGPLYLVAVSSTGESEVQLRQQLDYLYGQVLFILTSAQLKRIFDQRSNYDLRSLLAGTEMFLDQLARSFQRSPGFFLEAVQCLRLPSRLRQKISQNLTTATPQGLAFGMLLAKDHLVGLIRPKRFSLHPTDLHLITNMVSSSSGFRSGETWTPVCLPQFNSSAFLHAYVAFVGPDMCVVLVATDKDAFFGMSEYKQAIVEGLEETGCVDDIDDAIHAIPYSIVEVGVPALRHFICKSIPLVQYTHPAPSPPYTRKEDWRRLLRIYQCASESLHARTDPSSVFFHAGDSEAVVACVVSSYEIYAALSPLVSKSTAMEAVSALHSWLKRNDDHVFISSVPVIGAKT